VYEREKKEMPNDGVYIFLYLSMEYQLVCQETIFFDILLQCCQQACHLTVAVGNLAKKS
jgi:hypothetical protein